MECRDRILVARSLAGRRVREIVDEERFRLRGKAQHGAAQLRFSLADAALALQTRPLAVQFEQFSAEKGIPDNSAPRGTGTQPIKS